MSDEEVAVRINGVDYTKQEFFDLLDENGVPEHDQSAFRAFIESHEVMGLLPVSPGDLPYDVGDLW